MTDFLPTAYLFDEEIRQSLTKTTEARPEEDWLPAYHFDITLLSGETIGLCDLRIGHNERIYYGGNIGYFINENFRGHHYASKACKLLLKPAKAHGIECISISCKPDNIASAKTIQSLPIVSLLKGQKFLFGTICESKE